MRRTAIVIGVGLVLAVSGGIGIATTSGELEERPAPAVARVVPDSGQDLDATIISLQDTLRRVPRDHASWANLAVAYVEQARVTGLASYYEKADQATSRSFSIEPNENFIALAARAAIESARHDFAEALASAEEALNINPFDVGSLAIRVDTLTELGRYGEQMRALKTSDRRQPSTAIAARYAYAYELRGDLDRAAMILREAAANGGGSDRAYLLTLSADILRKQGRLAASGRDLEAAQQAAPGRLLAVVSSARLQTARGDLEGAVKSWKAVVARQPLPEYLTELGELLDHLGRTDESEEQYDVVRTTIELLAASGVKSDLETAIFEADHGAPQRALAQAEDEWSRRASVHVADAYAWALHRVGRDIKALTVARAATRLGTPEARFWIHRGTIEASLGMTAAARTHLRRGLATDPGMSPWQRDEALATLSQLPRTR